MRVLGSAPRGHQVPNIPPLGVEWWLLAATYRLIALKTKPCATGGHSSSFVTPTRVPTTAAVRRIGRYTYLWPVGICDG